MAEMDVLQSKIIQQIEIYLTEDNLKNDYHLSKYERENHGWIPVEHLNQFNKLSTYKLDTIINALQSKKSNIIEINFHIQPICIRRRRQPLKEPTIIENPYLYQTVVVNGLPRDAKHEELIEFFNRFHPIYKLKMLYSTRTNHSFTGKIHVIFKTIQDALAFVHRTESISLIYVNDYVLQLCNGYTLVCKLLIDCDDKDEQDILKQTDQLRFRNGQTFSHRLTNNLPRVSFNTTSFLSSEKANQTIHSKYSPIKSCLKSSTCATEQILFCQNLIDKTLSKVYKYRNQSIVNNCFTYNYSHHHLQQTYECRILTALNPYCFTVQLKQDAIEFDKFQRHINEFYNEFFDEKTYWISFEQIQINLCVISMDFKSSQTNRNWNRAQILDYDSIDQTVDLFYVDLGTWEEYVPIHRLRYLIEHFHQYFVVSLTCCLAHISPMTNENDQIWSSDATNQFLAVIIDQIRTDIEFLSLKNDGCFQTNLFVINSGQYVCVNDYMIHIKQAKPIVENINNKNKNDKSEQLNTIQTSLLIHPVIVLYNRLGEILKRSRKSLVKLIHIDIQSTNRNQNQLPLIFIYHEKLIFIPDFNISMLLQIINSNINLNDYTLAIQYQCKQITRLVHQDIFHQLDFFLSNKNIQIIALYTIDFVRSILEQYDFPIKTIYLELEKAKYAQSYSTDLSLWFTTDNQLNIPASDNSQRKKRLPFSNRLISPN